MPDQRRKRIEAEAEHTAAIARRAAVLGKWLWILPLLGALGIIAAAIGLVVVSIMKLVYLYRTAKIFREYPTET